MSFVTIKNYFFLADEKLMMDEYLKVVGPKAFGYDTPVV
jgi:hypothetical protein